MVTHTRLRSVVAGLCLYTLAALLLGYFAVNAYTGDRGLNARQDLDQQITEMTQERDRVKAERAIWQRRVSLLKSDGIDPDMLDERVRALLNYVDPRDVVMMLKRP